MADFRRWLYAFAVVALLAGLTVPASAQTAPFTCNTNAATPTVVRAEGYAELVGDFTLTCTGGSPTAAGQAVPQVQIQIVLNTNITSKLVASPFSEALLIIDEPNSSGANSNRPILNCGNAGAPDTGPSGPGVCSIISNGNPQQTYDGKTGVFGGTTVGGVTTDTACPANSSTFFGYGCGRPNVFQGRTGIGQNLNQSNVIVFSGVPLDPPGTGTSRSLRVTNIRADAEFLGVQSTFTQQTIVESIAINGSQTLQINRPDQTVAVVQRGLIMGTTASGANARVARLDFVQCNSENAALAGGASRVFGSPGGVNTSVALTPTVRFQEGFNTSFKPKNVAHILANGTFSTTGGGYQYNGGLNYPTDLNQNVPGAIYNTESGFEFFSNAASPTPNPPQGIGNGPVTANTTALASAGLGGTNTRPELAGSATQGTRLALNFASIPQGASIFVPPVVYLYRQNTTYCGGGVPTTSTSGGACLPGTTTNANSPATGVAVLTSTAADGSGAFTAVTGTSNLQQVAVTGGAGLAVYEILFSDPSSLEQLDVPVVVAYISNLTTNTPVGLPVTGTTAQVTGGFAPFYNPTTAVRSPSSSLPVPRFIPGTGPENLFLISKCACNLLFPFVSSVAPFDTGIAIANTTIDPGAAFGFTSAGRQDGAVTFFYYGTTPNNAPIPNATSNIVPGGQVLTYVVSSGGGAIGTGPNGLDGRAAGFTGYIIAQAQFQYCHGFAFISGVVNGPVTNPISEGYLAIVLDNVFNGGVLPRTVQAAENDGH